MNGRFKERCLLQDMEFKIFFEQQRIMAEKDNGELLRRVATKAKVYRKLMQELGYGPLDTLFSLFRAIDLPLPSSASCSTPSQQQLLDCLNCMLTQSLNGPRPSQTLSHILVGLETAISQLRDTQSQAEQVPQTAPVGQPEQKQRPKKKGNDKKKGKKGGKPERAGRVCALEEIQSRAMAETRCERVQLVQNLKKIEQLQEFLERKVLLNLCQQSMLHLVSGRVYA